MKIQVADQRPPLSVAISLAKKQGDSRLPQWQTELTQMVIEVTRKFHGSLTSENVTNGLQTCIGLLGLGLMHASEGRPDANVWLQHLQQHGIKKISAQAVELVKAIIALPRTDYLKPLASFDSSPREQLLYFVKEGYLALLADKAARQRNLQQVELAQWLLSNTSIGPVAKRNLFAALKDNVTADDVFLYILPRMAEIPFTYLPEQYNIEDEGSYEDDLDTFEGYGIKLPPAIWKKAKKRYDAFMATLPEHLRGATELDGESWFETRIRRDWDFEPEPEEEVPVEAKAKKPKATAKTTKAKATKTATAPKTIKTPKTPKASKTPKAATPKAPKAKA